MIVDIVETGFCQGSRLEVLEEICPLSARMNIEIKSTLKMEAWRIKKYYRHSGRKMMKIVKLTNVQAESAGNLIKEARMIMGTEKK